MPNISVIMPVYNSEKYLAKAIESVIAQTYDNWELLIINEYGSDDKSVDIVNEYANHDTRIRLIQNDSRLGLAESLNRGIREAKGNFIARLDADDLAHPTRFEKQLKFLEENRNLVLCGTYQHHFGPEVDCIHKPATSVEQCKANLLFFCDMCHSTVMFRRDVFIANKLFYDPKFQAEDFELWTRVANVGGIANIPEVLGEYRWGEDNITVEKMDRLQDESGRIVAKTLKNNLQIHLTEEESELFESWINPYQQNVTKKEKKDKLKHLKMVLYRIYDVNREKQVYDEQALLNVIGTKWRWAKYSFPFNRIENVKTIDDAFKMRICIPVINRVYYFWINNKGFKAKVRKIMKKLGIKKSRIKRWSI